MGVIEQAKVLASELARSKELTDFKAAESQVRTDQNATKMVTKYMEMEEAMLLKQMQGQQVTQDEVTKLNSWREQIMQNDIVRRFFVTKQSLDRLWLQLNQIISSVMGQ